MPDLVSISSVGGWRSDLGAFLGQGKKKAKAGENSEAQDLGPGQEQIQPTEQELERSRALAEQLTMPTLAQARELVGSLAGMIAASPPWKLMEAQPVASRSLVPRPYV